MYADRPQNDHFHKLTSGGTYGIGQTSGPSFREQKKVSLKILRNFGLGKNQMQVRVSCLCFRSLVDKKRYFYLCFASLVSFSMF